MSGTRPNKLIPDTVPQEESVSGNYEDSELTIRSCLTRDTLTEFEVKVNSLFLKPGFTIFPTTSIGIDANHEKYLTISQCNLQMIGTYIIKDTIILTGDEVIKAYVDGDGATEGSLTATVRFLDT